MHVWWTDEQVGVRDIVIYKKGDHEGDNEGNENKMFSFGPQRESCRSCFYKTLNLKHMKNIYGNQHDFWEKRREVFHPSKKDESAAIVPCKVQKVKDERKVKNGERKKPVSKMKELLKWAATSKSHKEGNKGWKVRLYIIKYIYINKNHAWSTISWIYFWRWVHFWLKESKNESRGTTAELKAPSDYSSTRSSKTSSRWDIGSCSTSSSTFSSSSVSSRNLQDPPDNLQSKKEDYSKRTGHWISTDSHCKYMHDSSTCF